MANTPILAIPLLSANQNAKENTINDAISFLERAINDVVTLNFSAGNIELPAIDLRRYFWFAAANVTAARTLTIPTGVKRIFCLDNTNGASPITVEMGAASWLCATGEIYVLATDGTNLRCLYNSITGESFAFPYLADVPNTYAGAGGYNVRVKADMTGLEFVDPNLGLGSLTGLSDTPANYTGSGLRLLRVNQAANGVEFVNPATVLHVAKVVEMEDAARTLALADLGAYIRTVFDLDVTITVPTNAAVAFPIGSQIHIRQGAAGPVTIAASVGVTINTPQTLKLSGPEATVSLLKVGTNTWDLFGSLEALEA